jgi:hypothetical protein
MQLYTLAISGWIVLIQHRDQYQHSFQIYIGAFSLKIDLDNGLYDQSKRKLQLLSDTGKSY